MEGDHLNCWLRGKEFFISTLSIQNLLQIRLVIPESSLPCDKRKTPVSEVVPNLRGERKRQSLHTISFSPDMRTLAYIMLFNLYPVRNLTTLSQPRALFLHDLYKKKDIDICAHIYYLLAKYVNKKKTWMTLPFSRLIMSILHQERVKIPSSFPVMKREDPISALTMTRNKTRLHGLEEEEGAPGENTTHEGGNTDDEIVNFTLEVEDTKALPTQA